MKKGSLAAIFLEQYEDEYKAWVKAVQEGNTLFGFRQWMDNFEDAINLKPKLATYYGPQLVETMPCDAGKFIYRDHNVNVLVDEDNYIVWYPIEIDGNQVGYVDHLHDLPKKVDELIDQLA